MPPPMDACAHAWHELRDAAASSFLVLPLALLVGSGTVLLVVAWAVILIVACVDEPHFEGAGASPGAVPRRSQQRGPQHGA